MPKENAIPTDSHKLRTLIPVNKIFFPRYICKNDDFHNNMNK